MTYAGRMMRRNKFRNEYQFTCNCDFCKKSKLLSKLYVKYNMNTSEVDLIAGLRIAEFDADWEYSKLKDEIARVSQTAMTGDMSDIEKALEVLSIYNKMPIAKFTAELEKYIGRKISDDIRDAFWNTGLSNVEFFKFIKE